MQATRMISPSSMPNFSDSEKVSLKKAEHKKTKPSRRICGTAQLHKHLMNLAYFSRPIWSLQDRLLQSMAVDIKLSATTATVVIEQTFCNDSDKPVEVHYSLGLNKKLAVFHFELERDGKVVVAEIKKTADARDDYDDAISMGHTGVMGEVNAKGAFEMSLGNVPPKGVITARVSIIAPVESDQETIFFGLPSDFFPSSTLNYSLKLNASAQFAGGLEEMIVTHGMQENECEAMIYSSREKVKDGVFAVIITPRIAFQPSVFVEDNSKSLAAAITFFPTWSHIDEDLITPYVECIFLVDRSGSMGGGFGPSRGGRIIKARDTLSLFLSSLPENSLFNIVGFGGRHESLFTSSQGYNQETLRSAQQHVAGMEANLGGTNLLSPLQAILAQPALSDYPRHVFILTDGQVSNREQTISFTQSARGNTTIHAVGIGSGADKLLVEGVAHAGHGLADMIPDKGDMRAVVIRQLSRALEPTLRKVELEWTDATADSLIPSADKIPAVIQGERLSIYAMDLVLTGPNPSLKLTGIAPDDEPFSATMSLADVAGKSQGNSIHRLAAWQRVQDLERGTPSKDEKSVIEKLGLEYSFATTQTAFSAMFENESLPEGQMQSVTVPGLADRRQLRAKRGMAPSSSSSGMQQQQQMQQQGFYATAKSSRSRSHSTDRDNGRRSVAHFDSADMSMSMSKSKSKSKKKKSPESRSSSRGGSPMQAPPGMPPPGMGSFGGGPPPPSPSFSAGPPAPPSGPPLRTSSLAKSAAPRRRLSNESREKKEMEEECDFLDADDLTSSGNFDTSALPAPKPKAAQRERKKAPTVAAPAVTINSSDDAVMKAAKLQDAVGFWTPASATLLTGIKTIDAPNQSADINLWSTALVIEYLAANFSGKEQEWRLFVKKARTWLKKALIKAKISEDYLQLAKSRIKK